jgi:hypothetical protein
MVAPAATGTGERKCALQALRRFFLT